MPRATPCIAFDELAELEAMDGSLFAAEAQQQEQEQQQARDGSAAEGDAHDEGSQDEGDKGQLCAPSEQGHPPISKQGTPPTTSKQDQLHPHQPRLPAVGMSSESASDTHSQANDAAPVSPSSHKSSSDEAWEQVEQEVPWQGVLDAAAL